MFLEAVAHTHMHIRRYKGQKQQKLIVYFYFKKFFCNKFF